MLFTQMTERTWNAIQTCGKFTYWAIWARAIKGRSEYFILLTYILPRASWCHLFFRFDLNIFFKFNKILYSLRDTCFFFCPTNSWVLPDKTVDFELWGGGGGWLTPPNPPRIYAPDLSKYNMCMHHLQF